MAATLPHLPPSQRPDDSYARTYPWEDWFDGQVWRVEHGVDFMVSPRSFANIVRVTAYRKGFTIRTRLDPDGVHVSFQAAPRDPEGGQQECTQ